MNIATLETSRRELATGRHLHQPARYRAADGHWHRTLGEALAACSNDLTWDPVTLFSEVALGYPCGDRTLIRQIERQPWMSRIEDDGTVCLEQIPPHGRRSLTAQQIAERLKELLHEEAAATCQGFREVYVLLSGGLDSRIVALTLRNLRREGRLDCKPVAVTWGLEDSRDVDYAREVAETLEFDWQHVSLAPEDLLENVELSARELGGLSWPTDMHRTSWFRHVSPSALVLGASVGDVVGRGEAGHATILEWKSLRPGSTYDLLQPEVRNLGRHGLFADVRVLRDRARGRPDYALYECEDGCHGGRGQHIHAMGLIDHYCHFYQMFTHPDLFSFMWSIHPSFRTDEVYARLLSSLDAKLAAFPWARTNRSVVSKTIGARRDLRREFDLYHDWVRGPLYDDLRQRIDPGWFGATGLFNATGVHRLGEAVRSGGMELRLQGKRPYCTWLWLAVFRRYLEYTQELKKTVHVDFDPHCSEDNPWRATPVRSVSTVRRVLRQSPFLLNLVRKIRRRSLRRRALREYPVVGDNRVGKP